MKSVLCCDVIHCSWNLFGALFPGLLRLSLPTYMNMLKSSHHSELLVTSQIAGIPFSDFADHSFGSGMFTKLLWRRLYLQGSYSLLLIIDIHKYITVTFYKILSIKKASWIHTNGMFFIISSGIPKTRTKNNLINCLQLHLTDYLSPFGQAAAYAMIP